MFIHCTINDYISPIISERGRGLLEIDVILFSSVTNVLTTEPYVG